jgi:hypothetical protein
VQHSGVAAGFLSVLLVALHYCIRGVEFFGLLKNFSEFFGICCSVAERCRCCCCENLGCRRRADRRIRSRWLVLLDQELFWEPEEDERHDEAIASAWSLWSSISRAIRRSHLSGGHCKWTWQAWNVFQGRLRSHTWHRKKKARQLLGR